MGTIGKFTLVRQGKKLSEIVCNIPRSVGCAAACHALLDRSVAMAAPCMILRLEKPGSLEGYEFSG